MTKTSRFIPLNDLVAYTDRLLNTPLMQQDACPNGLQIAGRPMVGKIVTGVTVNQALIEAAIVANADLLLTHHGFFWKNENPCLTGIKRKRIARLLAADLNLLVYHLPLDVHPLYGNNAQLGRKLGIHIEGNLPEEQFVLVGSLTEERKGTVFSARITEMLNRQPLHISAPAPRLIRRIAWCSGAGQGFIEKAALAGVDAYLTGEVSEQTPHIAREYNIHFYAAGHHATERYGVEALGQHLAEQFGIDHQFIDIHNPA